MDQPIRNYVIEPLSLRTDFGDEVRKWLQDEWGGDWSDTSSWLPASNDRPGAIVAVADNCPIGVLAFKRHRSQFQSKAELWINAVFVRPNRRRTGVGRDLVNHGTRVCISQGVKQVFAYTDVPELYLACGWQQAPIIGDGVMFTMVFRSVGG